MLNGRDLCGFGLILLAAHPVVINACANELTSGKSCFNNTTESMLEGKSIKVPFNSSETIKDLCIWNSSTSRWDSACQFSEGVCKPLLTKFREHVSIVGETFVLQNVTKDSERVYKLLDINANCVASINVSVSDHPSSGSGSSTIRLEEQSGTTWSYYLISVPVLAILDIL